jgi:hypothetical protein
MTLRDILVSAIGSCIIVVIVGHFKGENAALLCLGILVLLLAIVELFYLTQGLVIHWAGHGIGDDQYADVTNIVKGQVNNNRVNFVIDGALFPDDPYRGKKKHLLVRYSNRSRRIREKIRYDGDRLILP